MHAIAETSAPVRARTHYLARAVLMLSSLTLAPLTGCTEDEIPPGEPGGPCRVGAEPCVEGHACINGACAVSEPDAGTDEYSAEITLPATRVTADGETPVEFDFYVTTLPIDGARRAYDPEADGEIFIAVIPAEAGEVDPARPILVDGLGIATFVPCHRGSDPLCPEVATIRIARDDAPLDPIGESERILLDVPAPANPTDMGVDGGM